MSLDIKRPNINKTKKKTGFVVKMQLNNNNNNRGGNKRNIFVFFFFRNYYTWILWFFLSFYFFTTYFAGEDQSSPSIHLLSNHKTSSSLPSRALIESSAIKTTSIGKNRFFISSLFQIIHFSSKFDFFFWFLIKGMFSGMKIYVYDLPASYNDDWVKASDRCATHLFAAEVAIHRALLSSVFRTLDPEEADYFFVPVYVSCNFSTSNGFPSLSHARSLLRSAVDLLSVRYPFWNRTQGSDHVFVASHDFGACFHAMVSSQNLKLDFEW